MISFIRRFSVFVFALSFVLSQTIALVHDAVHPFHSHPAGSLAEPSHQHDHANAHPQGTMHSDSSTIETWLCQLWDANGHSAIAFSISPNVLSYLTVSAGLLMVLPSLFPVRIYPSFWQRAPPFLQ